jgi:hypothetical protein
MHVAAALDVPLAAVIRTLGHYDSLYSISLHRTLFIGRRRQRVRAYKRRVLTWAEQRESNTVLN